MNNIICYCGSGLKYDACCKLYHLKILVAPTAETLMRSRYSAFVVGNADYLYDTTHFSKRKDNSKNDYLNNTNNIKWQKLQIISSGLDFVEFKAFYLNKDFKTEVLHEKSNFKLENGMWYYVDGEFY